MKRNLAVPAAAAAVLAIAAAWSGSPGAPGKAADQARPAAGASVLAMTAQSGRTAVTGERDAKAVKTAKTAKTKKTDKHAKAHKSVKTAKTVKTTKTGKTAKVVKKAQASKDPKAATASAPDPVVAAAETRGGQYVTVVTCSSGPIPLPIHIGGSPLTVNGGGNLPSVLAISKTGYKTVYTCTITVKQRLPKIHLRKVVISTGFGGEAGSVARHHPAG